MHNKVYKSYFRAYMINNDTISKEEVGIQKDVEDVVAPFYLFLIFSFSKRKFCNGKKKVTR